MLSKIRQLLEKEVFTYQQNMDFIEYDKISKCILNATEAFRQPISLLDIGSGFCNLPIYVRRLYPHTLIHCIDLSSKLAAEAKRLGFFTSTANIIRLPYKDHSFHIVHCSHVIEHLSFPAVTFALDEMLRVVKQSGLVIIRSPLIANHRFYDDIDHIRPYPPKAILNYYRMAQQQKQGQFAIEEIDRWYTRIAIEINPYFLDNLLTKAMNSLFRIFWNRFRFPFARPNNYGIVLRKLHFATNW